MSAFVVITRDDKQGTVYPEIYGPFASNKEAEIFAGLAEDDEQWRTELRGGYHGVHLVSELTATSPLDWEPSDLSEYAG